MASYTGNLNLKKPALDDDALITDINNNMDILDAAVNGIQDGLAIVANGNTHVAITSGQFVYVRNHGTLTEGLYVASTNIAANATLSTSNLTADAAGGLNTVYASLNSNLGKRGTIDNITSDTYIMGLLPGTYHVMASTEEYVTSGWIPERWGTLTINRSDNNYHSCIFVSTHNEMYFRIFNSSNNTWYGAWQKLALNSKIPDNYETIPYIGRIYKSGRIVTLLFDDWVNPIDITIPSGYRPPATAMLAGIVQSEGQAKIGRVSINTNGTVTCPDGQTLVWGCCTWLV